MENWLGYYNSEVYQYNNESVYEFIAEAMRNAPSQLEVTKDKITYYNIPASFDIEVSSFKAYDNEHGNEIKCACMYIWQFGLNGSVIYGRTWDEFFELLTILQQALDIDEYKHLVIYVHNLGYEFQFIKDWIKWDKVFAVKQRRPVYAIAGGFEFRCSLLLSNYRLAYIGEHLLYKYPMEKKVGDLDYSLIRHSQTSLTPSELGYCINDVKVVMCYIQQKIEEDGDITKIPLTNTGYVREYCRDWCFYGGETDFFARDKHKKEYHRLMKSLVIHSDAEYYQMERAFAGGFTHASALHANKVLFDVGSADLTSDYPFQMCAKYYPMTSFRYIGAVENNDLFNFYLNNYCCLFDVTFINLKPSVTFENPISRSRCVLDSDAVFTVNNGRLVSASKVTTTITELDWETIYKFYDWDEVQIFNMRIADRGYLPKELILAILNLYAKKTTLKGLAEKLVEYMVSKNMLNSSFGMMVTAIIREEFEFDVSWHKSPPDIASQLDSYNSGYNRFLYYAWGVWVTAHARHSLFRAIYEFDEDYVYSDTDSIKGLHFDRHQEFFKQYNMEVKQLLLKMCNHYNIPFSMCQPKNKAGEKQVLGVWDMERPYKRFKTNGAKRYIFEYDDGELSLTVSGLNKYVAIPYLKEKYKTNARIFEEFGEGLYVPPGHTGKQTVTYIERQQEGEVTDYQGNPGHFKEMSAIYMEPQSYYMSILTEYKDFLEGVQYVEI